MIELLLIIIIMLLTAILAIYVKNEYKLLRKNKWFSKHFFAEFPKKDKEIAKKDKEIKEKVKRDYQNLFSYNGDKQE